MNNIVEVLAHCKKNYRFDVEEKFTKIRSKVPTVILALQSDDYRVSDVTVVREFVLDCVDFATGNCENSWILARETPDCRIYEILRDGFYSEKDERINIIDSLPNVGQATALCMLSFLFPNDYVILNQYVVQFLSQYEELIDVDSTKSSVSLSKKAAALAAQLNYVSALDLSLDLLVAADYILHQKYSKLPKMAYCVGIFEIKFYSLLERFETESDPEFGLSKSRGVAPA
jgi:hypothetical protein